jgi:hypothetical protein
VWEVGDLEEGSWGGGQGSCGDGGSGIREWE